MHHPALARLLAAWLVLAAVAASARADVASALADARRDLDRPDGAAAAAATLERALPKSGADKPAVLDLLRRAYEQAARQSEARGKPAEAETFRENLRILGRPGSTAARAQSAPTQAPAPNPPPAAAAAPPAASPDPVVPAFEPLPEVLAPPTPAPAAEPPAEMSIPARQARPAPEAASPDPGAAAGADAPPELPRPAAPSGLLPLPAPAAETGLAAADAAFLAARYAEAGQLYAGLAREKKLPAQRNDCWAYCRSVEVARRINAHPSDRAEWASIDAEIQQIRKLDPNNWIGEYLRNLAAERPGGRKLAGGGPPVVRGSSPDETPAAAPAGRPTRPQSPTAPEARPPAAMPRWQTRETTNFRIFHADPKLANQVATIAEMTRVRQTKFWTGAEPRDSWTPKCDIYLYPDGRLFAQGTGQPEDSPGFSTMNMNEGRLIGRRVSVRADYPTMLEAVLPHEVTHVILADWFTQQQIPRWADEGMAVFAEPAEEQRRRAADLNAPLAANQLFTIADLTTMDYPEPQYWNTYYAESVSLTRFLVEIGSPPLLLKYLQAAQKGDPEAELKRLYHIDGYADLQNKWLAYARKQAAAPAVATPANRPNTRVR